MIEALDARYLSAFKVLGHPALEFTSGLSFGSETLAVSAAASEFAIWTGSGVVLGINV